MSAYADMDGVRTILNLAAPTPEQQDRLNALNSAISDLLDRELGRSFGATEPDRTETGDGLGVSDVLPLRIGVRTVSAVTLDGVAFTAYTPVWPDRDGAFWALKTTDGSYWAGAVAITGQWGDQPYDRVPAAITEGATVLVAASFKADEAGPTGVVGPDGIPVQTRNPWKDERVQRALAQYRLAPVVL